MRFCFSTAAKILGRAQNFGARGAVLEREKEQNKGKRGKCSIMEI